MKFGHFKFFLRLFWPYEGALRRKKGRTTQRVQCKRTYMHATGRGKRICLLRVCSSQLAKDNPEAFKIPLSAFTKKITFPGI